METLLRDIRVTLRAFRRSPGFPLTRASRLNPANTLRSE